VQLATTSQLSHQIIRNVNSTVHVKSIYSTFSINQSINQSIRKRIRV